MCVCVCVCVHVCVCMCMCVCEVVIVSPFCTSGQDHIIRASRHYERAGQILTRNVVATASRYIVATPCDVPSLGECVVVTAPGGQWHVVPLSY